MHCVSWMEREKEKVLINNVSLHDIMHDLQEHVPLARTRSNKV